MMTSSATVFWLYMLGTRPTWGMIPARFAFAFVLVTQLFAMVDGWVVRAATVIVAILLMIGFGMRFVCGAIGATMILLGIVAGPMLLNFFGSISMTVLFSGVTLLFFTSGAGRHSIDHWISVRLLKRFPHEKKERYCIAELPLCKWWE